MNISTAAPDATAAGLNVTTQKSQSTLSPNVAARQRRHSRAGPSFPHRREFRGRTKSLQVSSGARAVRGGRAKRYAWIEIALAGAPESRATSPALARQVCRSHGGATKTPTTSRPGLAEHHLNNVGIIKQIARQNPVFDGACFMFALHVPFTVPLRIQHR